MDSEKPEQMMAEFIKFNSRCKSSSIEAIMKMIPRSRFFYEEFIVGLDNKCRYFRSLRVEMYKHIVSELRRRISPNTCLYFCMESDEIWEECGFPEGAARNLPDELDKAVNTI